MSAAVGTDPIEQIATQSLDIDPVTYFKNVASDRGYYVIEIPRLTIELVLKLFGSANTALGALGAVLSKVVQTENIVFFAQDIIALPKQCTTFANKTIQWWNEEASLQEFAHQGRKFIGHVGSTVGDYADGCAALIGLGAPLTALKVSSVVGSVGSAIGAASRITDYALEKPSVRSHNLMPQLDKVREAVAESRDLWNLSRDVSILSLSVLSLAVGFSSLPVLFSVGLPATILGSRMAAYYRELQLKAIDDSCAQMLAAKKIVKK